MNLSLKHCRIISSFVCPDSFPRETSRTTGKLALGPSEHLNFRNSQLDARRPTSISARTRLRPFRDSVPDTRESKGAMDKNPYKAPSRTLQAGNRNRKIYRQGTLAEPCGDWQPAARLCPRRADSLGLDWFVARICETCNVGDSGRRRRIGRLG